MAPHPSFGHPLPKGRGKVSNNTSQAIKGNFLLAPWGSRRLSISEYVSEDARRAGEGSSVSF